MPSYAYSAQYITINWNCVRLWKMLDLILLVMLFQTSHFKTYHNSYMCSFAKMYMHVHVVLTTFKIEGKQKFLSYGSSICIFKSQITNVSKFVRKRTFMCLAHLTFLEPTSSSVDVRGKTSQLLSRNMKAGLPSPTILLSKYYSQMSPLLFFLSLILEVFAKHLKSRQHPWFRGSVFLQNLATIVTSWTKTDLYKHKTFACDDIFWRKSTSADS